MHRLIAMRGFTSAVRTLTIISWPGRESEDISSSLPWFPVVGVLLGLVVYGTGCICMLLPFTQWCAGVALIMVAMEVWLTRGLHLDGLADWADSIGGFHQRERRLAIMKDVSLGAFGVLVLILALMAKWLAFERILSSGSAIWLLPIFGISRGTMVNLITTLPYARKGEGMGRPFVDGASMKHVFVAQSICLLFFLPFGLLGLVFFCLAGLITWIFQVRIRRQFGGITGDLLGTANELVEICLLILCALPGKGILYYTGWAWVL